MPNIMDWTQIFAIIAANAALFFWSRTESKSDIRHMDNKIDAIRELTYAIHLEVKDFHNKICRIEEKSKE
jgi:hypothetical protein